MFSPFSYAQLGVSQLKSQPADMAFVSRAFARLCSQSYGSRAKKSTIDASHLSARRAGTEVDQARAYAYPDGARR